MLIPFSCLRTVMVLIGFTCSIVLFAQVRAEAAPPCQFIGASTEYMEAQKTRAESASAKGDHRAAAAILGKTAKYAFDCVPQELREYIAGKPQGLDIPYTRQSLYGEAYVFYLDAHNEARLVKMGTCEYADGVVASMRAAESTQQAIADVRKKKLQGC